MPLRLVRAGRVLQQRVVLLMVFLVAASLSMVVASYSSATTPKAEPGYWLASSTGEVSAFGGAERFGSLNAGGPSAVVGIAATPDEGGYWLAAADGRVYPFGDAKLFGQWPTSAWPSPLSALLVRRTGGATGCLLAMAACSRSVTLVTSVQRARPTWARPLLAWPSPRVATATGSPPGTVTS